MTVRLALTASALLAFATPSSAQQPDLRAVFTAPIGIERAAQVVEIPVTVRAGKLFITAAVNGQTREFIFDTGSPSILAKDFADALGLTPVGQNRGTDAHGAQVRMDVAVTDTIALGDITFSKAPVMVFDYSDLPLGPCLIDGGVIGSEILPGSAWQIDLQRGVLRVAETVSALNGAPTLTAPLHDFGYPHAPIIDYAIGGLSDKALFDTGSAEDLSLFTKVFEDRGVQNAITRGSLRKGRGSEGESAGGRGETVDLNRFELSGLRIGGASPGAVDATTRSAPPTLVGAGLLDSYIVTLDFPGKRFLLEERTQKSLAGASAGFSIAFVGDEAQVVQLFEQSAAARAGLQLGDRVLSAHGRSLATSPDNDRCTSARWLIETFQPSAAGEIIVQRNGQPVALSVQATPAPN